MVTDRHQICFLNCLSERADLLCATSGHWFGKNVFPLGNMIDKFSFVPLTGDIMASNMAAAMGAILKIF